MFETQEMELNRTITNKLESSPTPITTLMKLKQFLKSVFTNITVQTSEKKYHCAVSLGCLDTRKFRIMKKIEIMKNLNLIKPGLSYIIYER